MIYTTIERLVDAYKNGDITLSERNAYLNSGKKLNDLINVGTPAGLTVGDLSMTADKIINLGAATAETDAANLSNIRQRIGYHAVTHDGGAVQAIFTAPIKARIDTITFLVTEAFTSEGTLKIGDSGDDDRLAGNADILKTIGAHVIDIGGAVIYSVATVVNLSVGSCSAGEGTVYIDYTLLP